MIIDRFEWKSEAMLTSVDDAPTFDVVIVAFTSISPAAPISFRIFLWPSICCMYRSQQQCKIDCLFIYITVNISVVVFPLYVCMSENLQQSTCEREISKEIHIHMYVCTSM